MVQVGQRVPFLLGMPSVRATVIGEHEGMYVLFQEYDTVNKQGEKIHVENTYYRSKWFIESYIRDLAR